MLNVMASLWSQPGQPQKYTHHHVNVWADSVDRHLSMPHRLSVITDMPEGIDERINIIPPLGEFENIVIPNWGQTRPQCLRRISLFRSDAAKWFGERFVSMDLDCVISGSLDPLFDRDEDFVMYRGAHAVRPYNGSMFMMTAGARSKVYDKFTPEGAAKASARFVGSDQAWISHILGPGEAVWDKSHGVYWQSDDKKQTGDEPVRVRFYPGTKKPWDLLDDPFVAENYRRGANRRCLILGYDPSVWEDAYQQTGEFDAVIASPEAAAHQNADGWSWGRVDAVSHTDAHAEQVARQLGFMPEQIVFCGRQKELDAA